MASQWNNPVDIKYLPSCTYFGLGHGYQLCMKCCNHDNCIDLLIQFENQKNLQQDLLEEQKDQM